MVLFFLHYDERWVIPCTNYIISNNCEVEFFVECVGGNEGVADDNFYGNSEDNSDESVNDV